MAPAGAGALDPRGPVAEAIADLWWLMLALGVVVFVIFAALLLAGLGRQASDDAPDMARHRQLVTRWIGVGGVAMPAVIIVVVFAATLQTMADVPSSAPADALKIEMTGHQFWYEIRYPGEGVVTANELHLPVGRDIAISLTSADVIHSFWVPELGGKLDMMPDRTNTLVVRADVPGEFRSRCAEFCGLQHTKMGLVVVAEDADSFRSWISSQQTFTEPTTADARGGRQVFVGAGCVNCHALRGASGGGTPAPDLTDLPLRRTLGAATLPNTRENLARWITDPHAIKEGVAMPGTALSDEQLDALITYLTATR